MCSIEDQFTYHSLSPHGLPHLADMLNREGGLKKNWIPIFLTYNNFVFVLIT